MTEKLTRTNADMLLYFWQEKGDPTRSSDWDEEKLKQTREGRRVLRTWENYHDAQDLISMSLAALVDSLEGEDEVV